MEEKVSLWHRFCHWLGLVSDFKDVYCKDNDPEWTYICDRCCYCGRAENEMRYIPKRLFSVNGV